MTNLRQGSVRRLLAGPDLTVVAWQSLIVTSAVEILSGFLGARIPLPVALLLSVSLLATARVAAAARPPAAGPPLPPARIEPATPDRPFRDVTRMADRLAWGRLGMDRFETAVRPVLLRLADDRLTGRHGITRASHPERARQLLGEDLWHLATGPSMASKAAGPPPDQVARLVEQLERI